MINLARLFTQHLGTPERALYRHFVDDTWRDVSVGEIARRAARWQAAFRSHGFVPGDRVGICLRNGVDWVALDLAALGAGLVVVPLYVEDNPENVAWCVRDAGARLVVVRDAPARDALIAAGVSAAGVLTLAAASADDPHSVERFLPEAAHDFTATPLAPRTLATICYTSGTSGRPKGVMLSHANILANVESIRRLKIAEATDELLSFLPVSHMLERTGGYYLPLAVGAKVAFARSVQTLAEDLASQRPTILFAVPRVLERFAQRIDAAFEAPGMKRRLFEECVERGWREATGAASMVDRMAAPVLRRVVAEPVLARLGGRLRLVVVGGAALEAHVPRLFMGLGLPVLQGYGMTEASPVIAVNTLWDNVPASVGKPLPGVEVRLSPEGEIIAKGENVMLGYWRNEEATGRAIDPAGWLHTGDLGELHDGKLYIRGRLKDILVMSNGEKLSPQDAELAILTDQAFENVVLVGEGKPFLTLLAVTQETDEDALVARANERLRSFPAWVRVRRVIATRDAWTVPNGLLTPTLKVKRERVIERFADALATVYGRAG